MNRIVRRSLAKHLLAAFAGVWLYAALLPCVLATAVPQCDHCPPAQGAAAADDESCTPAMQTDCGLPDLNPVSVDGSATAKIVPGILTTLPITAGQAPDIAAARHVENAVRRAPPPLALRPAVLLI